MSGRRLAGVVAAAILGLAWQPAAAQVMFPEDCSAGTGTTLVLVDVTTRYDDLDRNILRESIGEIVGKVTGGQRLSIRTIEDGFSHSRRLVEACIPYCPPLSWWQRLFSDCTEGRLAQKRRELAARLRVALAGVLDESQELAASDILRTIYYVGSEEVADGQKLSLYAFSDMLENSSFVGSAAFFSLRFEALFAKVEKARLIPFFPGASVTVFGVGRSHNPARPDLTVTQMERLNRFWEQYFRAAGAETVLITPRFALDR